MNVRSALAPMGKQSVAIGIKNTWVSIWAGSAKQRSSSESACVYRPCLTQSVSSDVGRRGEIIKILSNSSTVSQYLYYPSYYCLRQSNCLSKVIIQNKKLPRLN